MLTTDALGEIAAPAHGAGCVMEVSCSAANAEDAMGTDIGDYDKLRKRPVAWQFYWTFFDCGCGNVPRLWLVRYDVGRNSVQCYPNLPIEGGLFSVVSGIH